MSAGNYALEAATLAIGWFGVLCLIALAIVRVRG